MTRALLVGDVQVGILEAFPALATVLDPLADVLDRARGHGVPVIYVRAALRADPAEVPARNPVATWMAGAGELFRESSPATAVHPAVAPAAGDAVVVKRRASAFTGTDLDAVLRAHGVTDLAVAGVATSGVVLATVIDAADRDYGVTVLSDGCADPEPDVGAFLLERVLPGRGARVVRGREWVDGP